MKIKKLLAVVIMLVMLGCAVSAAAADEVASGECGENLTWVLDSDGVLKIDGIGAMEDYLYNYNYNDYVIPWKNYSEDIKSVVISEGVRSIGDMAFYGCSRLESIEIPDSVRSIGDMAFGWCESLTNIEIPDGVTNIGDSAFSASGYDSDESNWEDGVLYIGKYLIETDRSVISGEYTIKPGTKTIAENAFFRCKSLTSIEIPNSVKNIGVRAFYGCESLTNIEIPDSVMSIGESALYNTACYNDESNWEDGVLYIGNHLIEADREVIGNEYVIRPGTKTIADNAFSDCDSLTSIEIADGVTSIGEYAFYICDSLISIEIPDSVMRIGEYAFSECSNLEEIMVSENNLYYASSDGVLFDKEMTTLICCPESKVGAYVIPNNVTNIMNDAFYGCDSLTSIEIPDGVTSIGECAFYRCDSLISIEIPDSVTSIGSYAFGYCESLKSIVIPNGVTRISNATFSGCGKLESIEIPNSVITIDDRAFSRCGKLVSIEIPDSVMRIGEEAFGYCTSLKSIEIPNSVTIIEARAFSGCGKLVSIEIPDSVMRIGEEAFGYCTSLKSIEIPDSVTSIGSYAFSGCYSLNKVYTDSIEGWCGIAFENMLSNPMGYADGQLYINNVLIKDVTIPDTVTKINAYAFSYCESIESVEIPGSVTSIGDEAFFGCENLKSIEIPHSVTSIGNGAFSECGSLAEILVSDNNFCYTSINGVLFDEEITELLCCPGGKAGAYVVPNSVISIVNDAFYGCSRITSIEISEGVTSIGGDAFSGCYSLEMIEIPDSVTSIGSYAFSECYSLEMIEIPDSVTSIGSYAFSDTAYYDDEENWEDGVLYIGNHLIRADPWEISGEYVVRPGTKTIAGYAFSDCDSLTSIEISDGVTSIGECAFYWCDSLESIEIPDGVTSIGESAFYWCGSLASVKMPDSITSIGDFAFCWCGSLESIKIPEGITSIGESTFKDCDSLESIEIPKSVTSIGEGAFSYCYSLATVYYNGAKSDWEKIAIDANNWSLLYAEIIYSVKDDIEVNDVAIGEDVCSFEVEIKESFVQEGILYVNVYDEGGVLIGASIVDAESTNILVDVKIAGVPDSYKIFLWESLESMKPMAEACEDMF